VQVGEWGCYTANMDDDSAGPILGWSIGSGMSRRPIDELVEFPCVFRFKAVARAEETLVPDLIARVADVLGHPVDTSAWSTRDSSQGRYTCLTLDLWVTSGDEVYAIYEALRQDARITHLL
jgi:putative lipoic acid-binding regulatory protein